ncbi:Uncharacterised protein [Burkholderia pseudomallei]|nr:Uncharacterised protein [Burkholderia pseudomallei]
MFEHAGKILLIKGVLDHRADVAQLRHKLRRGPLGARTRHIGLQQTAQFVNFPNQRRIQARDNRPVAHRDFDEPFRFQVP